MKILEQGCLVENENKYTRLRKSQYHAGPFNQMTSSFLRKMLGKEETIVQV